MPKKAHLLEKKYKLAAPPGNRPRTHIDLRWLGASAPTPALLFPPTDICMSSAFLALNGFNITSRNNKSNNNKCSNFASSTFFAYFHLKPCRFCWLERKNIFSQVQSTHATLPMQPNNVADIGVGNRVGLPSSWNKSGQF